MLLFCLFTHRDYRELTPELKSNDNNLLEKNSISNNSNYSNSNIVIVIIVIIIVVLKVLL